MFQGLTLATGVVGVVGTSRPLVVANSSFFPSSRLFVFHCRILPPKAQRVSDSSEIESGNRVVEPTREA